jgi:hypothetical protein
MKIPYSFQKVHRERIINRPKINALLDELLWKKFSYCNKEEQGVQETNTTFKFFSCHE